MFEEVLQAKRPVLLWSGGLDSTLLLALLREQNVFVDIIQFGRDTWTKGQRQRADALIRDWGLKVFNYAPSNVSFIGDGQEISAVFEYAVSTATVPVVRDLVSGTRCIADLDGLRLHDTPLNYDLYIVGTRGEDSHYATTPKREWIVGDAKFIAPIFDMTRDEVKAELRVRDLDDTEVSDDEDTGSLPMCSLCLRAIETIDCPKGGRIDPQGAHLGLNLTEFRKRYDVL